MIDRRIGIVTTPSQIPARVPQEVDHLVLRISYCLFEGRASLKLSKPDLRQQLARAANYCEVQEGLCGCG